MERVVGVVKVVGGLWRRWLVVGMVKVEGSWWLALWRRWLVVGVVEKVVGVVVKVVGGWRCGWSKITIVKEKRLRQRSQPGDTNNSL